LDILTVHQTDPKEMQSLLYHLLVGGLAGWLGGKVIKGSGYGILANILIGIVGGVIGGWLFDLLGITTTGGFIGSLVTAFVGALLLLWLIGQSK
jgi:uncharacterized membrane protein YeaQ/YmgE (transglycosylase-associated protein family)